jgi:tetratricopeptide (TPR) repeat protein
MTLDASNLASLSQASYPLATYAYGYENSTGNLSLINHTSGIILSDSLNITFLCYRESDGIPVPACGELDGDYVAPAIGTGGTSSGSGGGSGGASAGSFERSEAQFELLSGELQEFILPVENKLSSIKSNLKVTVSGENSQYVSTEPAIISEIGPFSTYDLTVKIDAPSYFTRGKYLLKFSFSGDLVDSETGVKKSHNEEKYVTLYVVERTRDQADKYIELANDYIEEMNQSELRLDDVLKYLSEMNASYNEVNFLETEVAFLKLQAIYNAVVEYEELHGQLESQITWAENYGIDVLETQKLFMLAGVIHRRGDYLGALEKLQDAVEKYSFETKGEFNIYYVVKNNPAQSAGALAASLLVIFSGSYISLRTYLKRKLKLLKKEQALLLELMKVVQRYTFEDNKMSMNEYYEAMNYYEKKLSEAISERIKTEAQLMNLMKMRGKSKVLNQEKMRVKDLIRTLQDDYMNKGTIETRVYQNMLKTYANRLTKVEEELAFIDTKKFIKSNRKFKLGGKR